MRAMNSTQSNGVTGTGDRRARRGGLPLLLPIVLALAVLAGAPARAGAQCGADPGNDDFASATSLGSSCGTTPAGIDCSGDVDFYVFSASASASYAFTLTNFGASATITVYNSSGTPVGSSTSSVPYYINAGDFVWLKVEATSPGDTNTYHLQITGCSGGGCGNDQDGDTGATATVLRSGCGDLTGHAIDCAGDIDFFSWTAADAGTYTFGVSPTSTMRLTLFTAAGSWLGEGPSVDDAMTAGETVLMRIMSQSPSDTPTYTVTISGCSSGGCGADPGNDYLASATPLSGCGSTAAAIDCVGDLDYYWLTAPSSGSYTFETAGSTDTELRLYDANGDAIANDDDGGSGTNARIVYTLTAGQKYSVAVEEHLNDATGDYTLTVSGCSSGGCGNDPGNEDSDHATGLGADVGTWPATIDCPGDQDVYSFTASQSGSYTVTTSGSVKTLVQVFHGQTVDGRDDNTDGDNTASVTVSLSAGTKYFVGVSATSGSATGDYTLEITVPSSGTTYTYLVPASAKVLGLSGTDWRSDLSIVNTATVAASVTIEAWMRDQANPNPTAVTRVLAGGEAFNKTDLLASLFGFGSGSAAALLITSDQELAISTRTYNFTSSGTYGQYIRGRDVAASFQVGETAYLQGFREDATARSNLGLVNLAKVTNHVTVTFYAADGSKIGSPATYEVPAQGFIQKTRVLRPITSQPVELAWAKLTAVDGPFVGYLSLIDAASGDPTFRPTMAAWTSSAELILPGIAKVHGTAGTNWLSDMVLLNTMNTTQNVSVELWVRNDANTSPQTRSLSLAAHECRRLADVLPGLFGVNTGAAAFKISVGPGVIIDARTFNQVSSGSYGQYVPAMFRLQGVFSTLPGYFPMVTQNTAFRTNLGLVNGDRGPVKVKISLFDDSGTLVGTPITVDLADKAVTQIDKIVNRFTSVSFADGYLKLEVPSSYADHPVHAFVTVVDQKTGDPVYQTPVTVRP